MKSIPEHAKKVYEWILFDVYHFEVTWVDWNPRIFERVRWYDVVKAICIVDGKIIITDEVHPDHSKISLPWWMTHKWENPLDAIQREVREETWYTFKNWKLIKQFSLGKSNIEMHRYYYIAQDILDRWELQLDEWWEMLSLMRYDIEEFKRALKQNAISVNDFSHRYRENPDELDKLLTQVF